MSATVDQPAVVETTESKPAAQAEPVESKPETIAAEPLEPVATEAPKTEAASAAPAVEKAAISDGVLGYKAPGLIKSLRFVKKHFWFGDEAVAAKDLQAYLREEKAEVAQPNVAWSSQTGKGLLYFAKHADHKAAPSGIINLADITEPTKDGGVEFHFRLHGHKHAFQAPSTLERDAWLERIEAVAAEAKTQAEGIKNSAGYKENVEQIGKLATVSAPAAAAATAPRKSSDKTASGVKSDSSSSDSSHAPVEEKKAKSRRSRSASRKRTSLFGNLLGRKEDHEEKKTEAAAAPPKLTETEPLKEGETAKKTDDAEVPAAVPPPLDAPAVDAPAIPVDDDKPAPIAKDAEAPSATEPAKTTESTSAEPVTPKDAPKPTKRNSFFDSVFRRRDATTPAEEKREDEAAPAVPKKDSEVPATAPTLPEPATVSGDKPIEPVETPAPAVPVTNDASKEKSPSTPKESFFGRLLNLVEGKPQENKEAKVEDKKKVEAAGPAAAAAAETASTPADGTAQAPAAAPGPDTAATTSAGQPVAESAPPGLSKDKRRTSFFALASRGKEKKSEATSDSENTGNTSPIPRLSGLFRKPSRGAKTLLGQDKVESAPAAAEAKSEAKPSDTGAGPAVAPTEGTTTTTITADPAAPVQQSSEAPQVASTTDDIGPATATPAAAQPAKPAAEVQAAA